jgi:hypothetical protein
MIQIWLEVTPTKKSKVFLKNPAFFWLPLETQSVNRATFDFFPQNMATFVHFFPKIWQQNTV